MTQAEIENERNRLQQLYWQREKEFEAAKGKRTIITILGFALAYFLILYIIEKPTGFDIVSIFVSAMVLAGLHFFVNTLVFMYLFQKGHDESERLKAIQKQISDLE